MAFNGSGTFQRLYNWVNDAAANIKIRADRFDAEMDGMATGLSTCITKNGQTTITANLPMSTYKHTGVGNASARTEYAAYGQLQDGLVNWVAAGGAADAITATYSPSVTSLSDGQLFFVRAGAANATTTPTFSPNGLTARTIVKNGGSALAANDIFGAGHELVLRYNSANTRYELLNPVTNNVPTLDGNNTLSGNNTFTGTSDFQGIVKVTGKQLQLSKGADIASASSLPTPTDGNFSVVTGTTTITSIATSGKVGTKVTRQFSDALVLTHHATDLILPSGANITTAAGDVAEFIEYASGDWVCVNYERKNGKSLVSDLTLGTAQATTSGTAKDFSIPSGQKETTLGLIGVSTNGSSSFLVRIGNTTPETTGYVGYGQTNTVSGTAPQTNGFNIHVANSASGLFTGHVTIRLMNVDGGNYTYLASWKVVNTQATNSVCTGEGYITLSAEMDIVRLTTVSGDTFDAGTVNILGE